MKYTLTLNQLNCMKSILNSTKRWVCVQTEVMKEGRQHPVKHAAWSMATVNGLEKRGLIETKTETRTTTLEDYVFGNRRIVSAHCMKTLVRIIDSCCEFKISHKPTDYVTHTLHV